MKFGYELETSSGDVENDVIPALETAFNAKLLPDLFATQCGGSARRLRRRKLQAVGLSTRPDDAILANGKNGTKSQAILAFGISRLPIQFNVVPKRLTQTHVQSSKEGLQFSLTVFLKMSNNKSSQL